MEPVAEATHVAVPVSVVMPVYNGERYVADAIASVLAQTHGDLELVVVDDGSTDRTPQILADLAERDPRVRVVTQANQGQAAALNRGLVEARHDWVAIHDHDDLSAPQRLERQLRFLAANPDARVLGSYAIEIDEGDREIGRFPFGPTTPSGFAALRRRGGLAILVHPSVLLHHPTILALGGYDPAFGAAADTELWSRVADAHLVLTVPEFLLRYRVHGTSMSFERFFEQQRMLRWIRRRQDARRQGAPQPTLAQHTAWERGILGVRGLNHARLDWASFALRRARLARVANRPLRAMALLAVGLALTPQRTVRRVVRYAQRTRPAR